ncbi:MAG: LysM peptidoglycan-binding domain-containing protein [Armatimonadetes bacterium]|nr:LysM peptidoglycan-binding domain-containing protein [Armatimonadota bacterium]
MRAFLLLLISALVIAGCQSTQTVTTTKKEPTTVDEYAVLDDTKPSKPITDQVLNKQLEQARQQYVMALRASQQKRESVAAQHFEAALATLNDLSTYPNIDSYPEVDKLAQSIIRDYEEQISSLDSLDPNSNFLVLRDKMYQEIEAIPVERKQYPKADPKTGQVEASEEPSPLQIVLSENEKVEQCIAFFTATEKGRKIFGTWLERTGRYFPMYERVMEEEGVPDEIKHLSMIESGLKPTAVSWAKAAGLWQFIPSTGQMYGMTINWHVDERRDPEKATRAAARYLRDLYQDLGDWHLALASYNCGPGRVKSAIAKANSRDYWTISEYLPRETRQYVPLFIAATKITMNPETYGFTNIRYMAPAAYDTLTVKTVFGFDDVAKAAGVSVADLRELNPELLRDQLPQKDSLYLLKIPQAAREMLIAAMEAMPEPEQPKVTFVSHKVARGESIKGISKRYGVTTDDIYAANRMTPKSKLRRGALLKIPVQSKVNDDAGNAPLLAAKDSAPAASPTTATKSATPPEPTAAAAPSQQPSEPMAVASAPRRTRSAKVEQRTEAASGNGATATTPSSSSPTLAAAATKQPTAELPPAKKLVTKTVTKTSRHKVARNENIAGIAKRYGVKSSDLIAWNRLGKKGSLKAGQTLEIKKTVKVQEWVAVKTETPKNNGGGATMGADSQQKLPPASVALKTKTTIPAATATNADEAAEIAEAATIESTPEKSVSAPAMVPGKQTTAAAATLEKAKSQPASAAAITAKKPDAVAKAEPAKTAKGKKPVTTTSTTFEIHKVKQGESLSAVADQYGVSMNDLKAWNQSTIHGNTLLSGTKLKIYSESPSKGDAKKSSRNSRSSRGRSKPSAHAIKKGETMETIAKRHGMSVQELKKLNPKLKETQLQIGGKVKVKK